MSREVIAATPEAFAEFLHKLRLTRRRRKAELRGTIAPRQSLTPAEREEVFRKTAGRCHICGGAIDGKKWHADHVFSHSAGGAHAANNCLPAHALCNNYEWDYSAGEFQAILKLGVWARTEIEHKSTLGLKVADRGISRMSAPAMVVAKDRLTNEALEAKPGMGEDALYTAAVDKRLLGTAQRECLTG